MVLESLDMHMSKVPLSEKTGQTVGELIQALVWGGVTCCGFQPQLKVGKNICIHQHMNF